MFCSMAFERLTHYQEMNIILGDKFLLTTLRHFWSAPIHIQRYEYYINNDMSGTFSWSLTASVTRFQVVYYTYYNCFEIFSDKGVSTE